MRRGSDIIASLRRMAVPLMLLAAQPATAAPSRIVSLNLCADQLVLALADREAISAVTWMATDCALSARCTQAAGVPAGFGTAEELYLTMPDLVITGRYTARTAVAVARRRGLPVVELDLPRDMDMIRAQIRTVAGAIGHPQRGEAMIAEIDHRIAAIPAASADAPRPVAVVYQANGFTVAAGSLVDHLMTKAGLDNLATRLGIDNYPFLPLESLVAGRPDILIVDDPDRLRPSLAQAALRHPVLAELLTPEHRAVVPQRLWSCGDISAVDALERLAAMRQRMQHRDMP